MQQEDELVVTVCALVHTSGGGRDTGLQRSQATPQEAPDPTWATCLAYLLLTNTLKKNSGAKMLWGMVSWHGEFSRHSHLGTHSQALVLQIMHSTCQALTSPSTPQTLVSTS